MKKKRNTLDKQRRDVRSVEGTSLFSARGEEID